MPKRLGLLSTLLAVFFFSLALDSANAQIGNGRLLKKIFGVEEKKPKPSSNAKKKNSEHSTEEGDTHAGGKCKPILISITESKGRDEQRRPFIGSAIESDQR